MNVDAQVGELRARAGLIDRSRGFVRVTGPDRIRFLQGMISVDVAALAAGQGVYGLHMTPKAHIVADLVAYSGDGWILCETEAERGAALAASLDGFLVMEDVEVRDESSALAVVEVVGPRAFEAAGVAPLGPHEHREAGGVLACGVRYAGLPALRLIGPPDAVASRRGALAAAGVPPCDEAALEVVRIEAGVPRFGAELAGDTFPLEIVPDAVSTTKGCYLGQEPIARVTARGRVRWQLRGLALDDGAVPPRGTVLAAPDRAEAAHVTSSCRSPSLGPVALARVWSALAAPGTALRLPDGRAAVVRDLPLVRA